MRHLEMEAQLRHQDHQREAAALHLLHQVPRTSVVHQLAESLRALADRLDHLQDRPQKGHWA